MSEEDECLFADKMLHVMKKSKKDRKKVLNTCTLILKAAEDSENDIVDVETLMKVHGGLRDTFNVGEDEPFGKFLA